MKCLVCFPKGNIVNGRCDNPACNTAYPVGRYKRSARNEKVSGSRSRYLEDSDSNGGWSNVAAAYDDAPGEMDD